MKFHERAKKLDCGDNSCHFAADKTGMRTNGGCRCDRTPTFKYIMAREIKAVDNLLEQIRVLKDAINKLDDIAQHTSSHHLMVIICDIAQPALAKQERLAKQLENL